MNTAYYIVCTKVHAWLIGDLVTWHLGLIYIYLNISDDILTKFNIVNHTKCLSFLLISQSKYTVVSCTLLVIRKYSTESWPCDIGKTGTAL